MEELYSRSTACRRWPLSLFEIGKTLYILSQIKLRSFDGALHIVGVDRRDPNPRGLYF
jgi:hypothetical protein